MLPSKDQQYLKSQSITFEAKAEGSKKGVILKDFPLPHGKFEQDQADILILLPSGYPDARPDCFYTSPSLKLTQTKQLPKATRPNNLVFNQQKWQFWSRHNSDWRPGIDGIRTMIKRVEYSLEAAR